MPLTYYQIAHAKPRWTTYKLRDSDTLHLAIKPNGAKLWRMNYRYLDRQKTDLPRPSGLNGLLVH